MLALSQRSVGWVVKANFARQRHPFLYVSEFTSLQYDASKLLHLYLCRLRSKLVLLLLTLILTPKRFVWHEVN